MLALKLQVLEDTRSSHSATDTHRHHPIVRLASALETCSMFSNLRCFKHQNRSHHPVAGPPVGGLAVGKSLYACNIASDNQRLDSIGALVGEHRLNVGMVASNVIL